MIKKKLITSSRDKNLLIFLVTLIGMFLVYKYLVTPAFLKGQALASQADSAAHELETAEAAVASLPENRATDARTFEGLTEKYKVFFYEINQGRILYHLDSIMSAAGIPVISYTQTPTTVEAIPVHVSEYTSLSYPLLSDAAAMNDRLTPGAQKPADRGQSVASGTEIPQDALPVTHIEFSFAGTGYENVLAFLGQLDTTGRSVIVEGITLSKAAEGGMLEGDISLSVYALPKLDPDQASDLAFRPVIVPGKANPFQ